MKTRRHRNRTQRGGIGFPSWFNKTTRSILTDDCKSKFWRKKNTSEKCNLQRNAELFIQKTPQFLDVLAPMIPQANNSVDLINSILTSDKPIETKIKTLKGIFTTENLNAFFKTATQPWSDLKSTDKMKILKGIYGENLFDFFKMQGFSEKVQIDQLKLLFGTKNICEILDEHGGELNEDERVGIKALLHNFYASENPATSESTPFELDQFQRPPDTPEIILKHIHYECLSKQGKIVKKILDVEIFTHIIIKYQNDPEQLKYGLQLFEEQEDWLTGKFLPFKITSQRLMVMKILADLMLGMLYNDHDFFIEHVDLFKKLNRLNIFNDDTKIKTAVKEYFAVDPDTEKYKKSYLSFLLPPLLQSYESTIIDTFPEFGFFNQAGQLLRVNKESFKSDIQDKNINEANGVDSDEIFNISWLLYDLIDFFVTKVTKYPAKKHLSFASRAIFLGINTAISSMIKDPPKAK